MVEEWFMPIVAALVALAVLVAIPVIVVRSSIAKRREQGSKRSNWVEPKPEPSHGPAGRHRGRRSHR